MNSTPILMTPAPRRAHSGFTLIELLTVIAIIGILAAILIPTVATVRQSARSARAISNAKQVGMANILFSNDNRGAVLGQGSNFDDSVYLFRQVSRYVTARFNSSIENVSNSIEPLVDPLVPPEFIKYGEYSFAWSMNSIFNMRNGKFYQGVGGWQTVPNSTDRVQTARRIQEFREPSRLILAVSGGYEFGLTQAANEALLATPTGRQPIFYYHRDGKATPAVFLDGHAELLSFPIDPSRIRPQ